MEVAHEDGSSAQGGGGVAGEGGGRGGEDQEQKPGAKAGGHSASLAWEQVSSSSFTGFKACSDTPYSSGPKSME